MERSHVKFSFTSKLKHVLGAILLLMAFILYIYGICAPVVRITGGGPGVFDSQVGDHDFSLPRLLQLLLDQGDYVPFVCIFVFSFALPLFKFCLFAAALVSSAWCRLWAYSVSFPLKIITLLRVVAKYQLVDVFSTIILVSFINFVGVSAELLFAAGSYQAYCLLSILSTQWLCHCHSETLEQCMLIECSGRFRRFHAALCSPLLPQCVPVNVCMHEDIAPKRVITPGDFSEGSTTFSAHRLPVATSPASVDSRGNGRFYWYSQSIRQRAFSHSHSPSPDDSYPRSVNLSADFPGDAVSTDDQPSNSGTTNLPLGGNGDVGSVGEGGECWAVKAAGIPSPLLALPRDLCLRGGRSLDELPHALDSIKETIPPDELVQISEAVLPRSAYPICSFSECLLRMFLLACSFFISAFAALICWARPVLQVILVPGKQRGFAIETSSMSLGDIFWRLYSMGHMWNGCVIIVVFPLLATLILYVASIGTVASACTVYWALRNSDQHPASPIPGNVPQSHSSAVSIPQKALQITKTLSNISAFLGDVAMPDVQSIGLLTCYFIANNIDFLGARLPTAPSAQPSCTLERLLWNLSGFWAMVALGVSASQVHRLAISFEDVCQDLHALFHRENPMNDPYLSSSLLGADPRSLRTLFCSSEGPIRDDSLGLTREDAAVAHPPALTVPMEDSRTFSCKARGKKRRNPLFGLLFHGCVRLGVSVVLLLPIWLKPAGIVDVDLGRVNEQLQGLTEYVNPLLKKVLPQSFGDCASVTHAAPPPCTGSMPLAYIRTEVYEATARWATGVNTTELQAVRFDATPKNRIVLTVKGKVKSLSLSLRIGGCFYGDDRGSCPVLWDSTDGCCGDDIEFMLQMSVKCNHSFPYLADASFLETHISRLIVKEKILGIFPVEVADITQVVEDQLSEWAQTFLDPQNKWIHWKDGETLSVINLLNVLLNINAPAGIRCPRV